MTEQRKTDSRYHANDMACHLTLHKKYSFGMFYFRFFFFFLSLISIFLRILLKFRKIFFFLLELILRLASPKPMKLQLYCKHTAKSEVHKV